MSQTQDSQHALCFQVSRKLINVGTKHARMHARIPLIPTHLFTTCFLLSSKSHFIPSNTTSACTDAQKHAHAHTQTSMHASTHTKTKSHTHILRSKMDCHFKGVMKSWDSFSLSNVERTYRDDRRDVVMITRDVMILSECRSNVQHACGDDLRCVPKKFWISALLPRYRAVSAVTQIFSHLTDTVA